MLLLGAHGVQVAPKIKGHLMDKGNALVGYQPLGNIPNFFRMILSNPASTYNDADQLLDEIAMFGELWPLGVARAASSPAPRSRMPGKFVGLRVLDTAVNHIIRKKCLRMCHFQMKQDSF